MAATSELATDLTVNEAEYRGLLICFDLLAKIKPGARNHLRRLYLCDLANVGEIDCKTPGLQLLRLKYMEKLESWTTHEVLHMKRYWNQIADRLASDNYREGKVRSGAITA